MGEGGASILAVDDDPDALATLADLLRGAGYTVHTAGNGSETLKAISQHRPDIVLLDVQMPSPDGYEVTRQIKADAQLRFTTIILLTAKSDLDDIVHGFAQGADDYIRKPYQRQELLARVHAALRIRNLYREIQLSSLKNRELTRQLNERSRFADLVGRAPAMRALYEMIEKVSDSHLPVLILGESGTGKELVARAVHAQSARRDQPFIAQNCSAFSENLLESELFGHLRGAFSGAMRDKQGLFEAADGGSLFLDEVGEMSPALQAKLLRVLQDGTFMPVGSTKTKKVDVRVIAATHRDLPAMVKRGEFREDLFYRMNVITLRLPALRDRREDIALLVEHFLRQIAQRNGRAEKQLAPQTLRALSDFAWPGNIRQLQNEVERLVLLAGDADVLVPELLSSELTASLSASHAGRGTGDQPTSSADASSELPTLKEAIDALERRMIEAALVKYDWNKSEAARALGISRSNLISKVQGYGLER